MIVLDDGEQRTVVIAAHPMLDKELRRVQPRPGDSVRVKYLGRRPWRYGRRHSYFAEVARCGQ
jgi:hypothetical protein